MSKLEQGFGVSGLSQLSDAKSRSISAENPSGASGQGGRASAGTGASAARELGVGWKVSPSIEIPPGSVATLAEISGSGTIRHIWMALLENVKLRNLILRIYWDASDRPAVETPLGDFFCCDARTFSQINSLAVCVNPGRALNCFWEMPFRAAAIVTLENRDPVETATLYYQIDYVESIVDESFGYFHAEFRRSNPLPEKQPHTLLDNVTGRGHYVGTFMNWCVREPGWWGEGEFKFYLDDDSDYPTICGTGTEDYFLGSHNFDVGAALTDQPSEYTEFTTAYSGFCQLSNIEGIYMPKQRFGMYRWHIVDPIRFASRLRVNVQALGWHDFFGEGRDLEYRRYLPLQDDIASVAYWYQDSLGHELPELPNIDALIIT